MAVVALAAATRPLAAQESRAQPSRVPVTFTPPAGLCRVWLDGVPASQQPAPTDCASAIKNRPASAAVVFGPKRQAEPHELGSFTKPGDRPSARTFSPNALASPRRREVRDGAAADATPKSARKPDKPDKPDKPEMTQ